MAILVQDGFPVYPIQSHARLATSGIEFRLGSRKAISEQNRLLVRSHVCNHGSVTTVIVLRVPSVVTLLVQERFAVWSPVSLPDHLAAAIKDIHDPVDSRLSFERRLVLRIEIGFFQLVSIRIILALNDGVAARDNDRFAVSTNEGD